MVLVAESKLNCTDLIFVERGAKISGKYCRDGLLMQKPLQVICSIAKDVFGFQQDNAPAHHARGIVELLRSETPQFISPDMWPANSPDLNPVNYRICGTLQYRIPIRYRPMDKLQKGLVATWADFQHSVVDYAVDQWRKRLELEACILAEGDHF